MNRTVVIPTKARMFYGSADPVFLYAKDAPRPQAYLVDEETILKDMGHGEAQVSFGSGERPKYRAVSRAISDFYADLQRPLIAYRQGVFMALGLADATKAFARGLKADDLPFRFTTRMARDIDAMSEEFLTELFGPQRGREAFANRVPTDDNPDGIVQQYEQLGHAIGVVRGGRLVDQPVTLDTSRTAPDVVAMLEHGFDRLSVNGQLRLESVSDDVKALLVSYQDAGLSPLETARELTARFDQYEGWQFERLARTEMAYASEEGIQNQLKDYGVENVEILISAGACPICEAFEDQLIPIDDEERLPPYHPNCVTGGTLVSGPKALASTTRWYAGDVVEIQTRSGRKVTVTPNHPMLTPKGWIAAGLIHEGDDCICGCRRDGIPPGVGPDDYQVPSLIENVAAAIGGSLGVPPTTVPTSPEDFHGDGGGSEVCVVRTNRLLGNTDDAALLQPFTEQQLCRRHAKLLVLARSGAEALGLEAVRSSTGGSMGERGQAITLLGGTLRRQALLNRVSRMKWDAVRAKEVRDNGTTDLELPSESSLILAGEVETDHVVRVQWHSFAGHVYNLQTKTGWYTANTIVTHNCLCSISPAVQGF